MIPNKGTGFVSLSSYKIFTSLHLPLLLGGGSHPKPCIFNYIYRHNIWMHISFAGLHKSIFMSPDIIPSCSPSLNNYKTCLPPVSLPKIHRGVDVSHIRSPPPSQVHATFALRNSPWAMVDSSSKQPLAREIRHGEKHDEPSCWWKEHFLYILISLFRLLQSKDVSELHTQTLL